MWRLVRGLSKVLLGVGAEGCCGGAQDLADLLVLVDEGLELGVLELQTRGTRRNFRLIGSRDSTWRNESKIGGPLKAPQSKAEYGWGAVGVKETSLMGSTDRPLEGMGHLKAYQLVEVRLVTDFSDVCHVHTCRLKSRDASAKNGVSCGQAAAKGNCTSSRPIPDGESSYTLEFTSACMHGCTCGCLRTGEGLVDGDVLQLLHGAHVIQRRQAEELLYTQRFANTPMSS